MFGEGLTLEMLKMKIDPAMYMKTNGNATKYPSLNTRLFTRKCTQLCVQKQKRMTNDEHNAKSPAHLLLIITRHSSLVTELMNEQLRQEVRFLTTRLGAMVREQSGPEVFSAIEVLRKVAKQIRQTPNCQAAEGQGARGQSPFRGGGHGRRACFQPLFSPRQSL